jgi:hypothetical protein
MIQQLGGMGNVVEMMKSLSENGQMKDIMASMGMGNRKMPDSSQWE